MIDLGPDHDWSSHAADAFGMMCTVYEEPTVKKHERRTVDNRSWLSM
jgi:phage terminase large subunit